MAKEWYLISSSTKPNSLGGYENDGFLEYKDDSFSETLETNIATTVVLCNSDLTERKTIRCIIEGNTSDTQLRSMERTGLFQRGTVKAGMYILFENRYWLIDGYPGTNGVYEKATMCLCQHLLRWQNQNGVIIERWCNITSASKYDVGESGNSIVILTSNNYTLKITSDKETLQLEDKRVFIDKKNINPTKIFKLTRDDDVLYDYGDDYHGSILSYIATKDDINYNTDNQDLKICDYHSSIDNNDHPFELSNVTAVISGSNTLRLNQKKTWSVSFKKNNESVEDINFSWEINNDSIVSSISKNKITLSFTDSDIVGQSITLQVLNEQHDILAEMPITLIDEL